MLQDERTSFPMDYDAYAPTYFWARKAVPWGCSSLSCDRAARYRQERRSSKSGAEQAITSRRWRGDGTHTHDFLQRLEAKCSSAMRLLEPAAHAAGMMRVRAARQEGRQWLSCYEVLLYAHSQ